MQRSHDHNGTERRSERRRVLLIGGAGYIGSVLSADLLAHGYRVHCLDRLLYENEATVVPLVGEGGYAFDYVDLADCRAVAAAACGATDAVILGALVGDPITRRYPNESKAINLDGTLALLDVLDDCGLDRVVFVSTCSNYGLIPDDTLADEAYPLRPMSLYAEAKVAVEQRIETLRGKVAYHPTVLRFATAFGVSPRMRFDLTISQFTREMYLGRELVVYDPDTWRPYCHVRDFAEIIRRILEAPAESVTFEVFNAGGEVNNFTKRMIVEEIREFLPDAPVRYQDHGEDPRNYRVDFTKIRERLAFEPRHTVPSGIRELIGAIEKHLFDGVEARPNFYGNYEIVYP